MDKERLKEQWLKEERAAHIQGWDFSHIQGRYEEENDLPWSYRAVIEQYLESRYRLLDLDTGGGEFLLSLRHPYSNTSATEAYPPNVRLCEKTLCPLGVDFHRADASEDLPFEDEAFDIVINRHGSFCVSELHRVVKRGGIFITEQVGAENDTALVELLLPGTELPFPEMRLKLVSKRFQKAGFVILQSQEAFRPIKFYDVGAFVWFAHVIAWEFPGFTVEKCLKELYRAQEILEQTGCLEGQIHRFLLAARKA